MNYAQIKRLYFRGNQKHADVLNVVPVFMKRAGKMIVLNVNGLKVGNLLVEWIRPAY